MAAIPPDYFRREEKLREVLRIWDPMGFGSRQRSYDDHLSGMFDVLRGNPDISYVQDNFRYWVHENTNRKYDKKASQPFVRELLKYWRESRLTEVDESHDLVSHEVKQTTNTVAPRFEGVCFTFAGDWGEWENKEVVTRVAEEGARVSKEPGPDVDYLVCNESPESLKQYAEVETLNASGATIQVLDQWQFAELFQPSRDEANKLLRAGPIGIARWNRLHEVWDGHVFHYGDEREAHPPLQLDLEGVDFENAELEGVCFDSVLLDRANFRKANLASAVLGHVQTACFDGACMKESRALGLLDCSAIEADFSGVRLNLARLDGTDASGAVFANASAHTVSFRNAKFVNANFSHAQFNHECDFSDSDLSNADFTNADFSGASFRNASLRETQLSGAELMHVDFTDCDLSDANLTNANLAQVDLLNAKVERAIFDGANLTGAKLESDVGASVTFVAGAASKRWHDVFLKAKKMDTQAKLILPTKVVTAWIQGTSSARFSYLGCSLSEVLEDGTPRGIPPPTIASTDTWDQLCEVLQLLATRFSGAAVDEKSITSGQKDAPVKGRELKEMAIAMWLEVFPKE